MTTMTYDEPSERERLMLKRRRLGMVQLELAKAAATSQSTISEWERGKRQLREATLERIRAALARKEAQS